MAEEELLISAGRPAVYLSDHSSPRATDLHSFLFESKSYTHSSSAVMTSVEPIGPVSQVSNPHVEPHMGPSSNDFVFEPAVKMITTPSERELDKAMRDKRAVKLRKLREQRLSMFRKAHAYYKKSGWKVGVFFYHPSRNKHYAYVTVPKPGLGEKVSPEKQFPPSINRIVSTPRRVCSSTHTPADTYQRKKLPKADIWFPEDAADPENPGQDIERTKLFLKKYRKTPKAAQLQKSVGPVYHPEGNSLPSPSPQSAWSVMDPFQAGVAPQPFLLSPFQPLRPAEPITNQLQPVMNPFRYPQPFLQAPLRPIQPGNLIRPGPDDPGQYPEPLQELRSTRVGDGVAQLLTDSEFEGPRSAHDSSDDVNSDRESDDSTTDDDHEDADMVSAYSETEVPAYQGQPGTHEAEPHTPASTGPGCVSDEQNSVQRDMESCDQVQASVPRAGSRNMAASTTPESSGCPTETPPNWGVFQTPPMSDYMSIGYNAPGLGQNCSSDDLGTYTPTPVVVSGSPGARPDDGNTCTWMGDSLRSTSISLPTPMSDYPLAPLMDDPPVFGQSGPTETDLEVIEPRELASARRSARRVVPTRSKINSAMNTGHSRLTRAAKSRSRGRTTRTTPSTKASSNKPSSAERRQERRGSHGGAESSRRPGTQHTRIYIDLPVLTAEQKAEYVKVDWE